MYRDLGLKPLERKEFRTFLDQAAKDAPERKEVERVLDKL
jgi:hypothetical protein